MVVDYHIPAKGSPIGDHGVRTHYGYICIIDPGLNWFQQTRHTALDIVAYDAASPMMQQSITVLVPMNASDMMMEFLITVPPELLLPEYDRIADSTMDHAALSNDGLNNFTGFTDKMSRVYRVWGIDFPVGVKKV